MREPYWTSRDGRVTLYHGDSLDVLPTLAESSIDSCVCDPPYELGFMGRAWDASGIAYSVDLWRAVLRVLKPGAHLLAFGGTRTYHRMACAIEDAGFEIRDSIAWHYGSGFPKSLDVSKAIDKAAGAEREVVGSYKATGTAARKSASGGVSSFGTSAADEGTTVVDPDAKVYITTPATDAARQWSGWGTALKPATEPIVVARKPLVGTVAANVQALGTGAINVDACRVGTSGGDDYGRSAANARGTINAHNGFDGAAFKIAERDGDYASPAGRWPPNLLLTHSAECADECAEDCPVRMLDEQSGERRNGGQNATSADRVRDAGEGFAMTKGTARPGDTGTASRFFPAFYYTAKPSTAEREQGLEHRKRRRVTDGRSTPIDTPRLRGETQRANIHPTVKPVDLMRWLVRLVTQPGGLVLDPFAGSGTTLIAAQAEQMRAVGIEREAEHCDIARDRVAGDAPLFAGYEP